MLGKIFLTSQGFYSKLVKERFFKEILDKQTKSVAFIKTASKEKEENKFNIRDKHILLEMGFKSVDFVDLETQQNIDFTKYNVFYVAGGNTLKLLKYARETNFKNAVIELIDLFRKFQETNTTITDFATSQGRHFLHLCGSIVQGNSPISDIRYRTCVKSFLEISALFNQYLDSSSTKISWDFPAFYLKYLKDQRIQRIFVTLLNGSISGNYNSLILELNKN